MRCIGNYNLNNSDIAILWNCWHNRKKKTRVDKGESFEEMPRIYFNFMWNTCFELCSLTGIITVSIHTKHTLRKRAADRKRTTRLSITLLQNLWKKLAKKPGKSSKSLEIAQKKLEVCAGLPAVDRNVWKYNVILHRWSLKITQFVLIIYASDDFLTIFTPCRSKNIDRRTPLINMYSKIQENLYTSKFVKKNLQDFLLEYPDPTKFTSICPSLLNL